MKAYDDLVFYLQRFYNLENLQLKRRLDTIDGMEMVRMLANYNNEEANSLYANFTQLYYVLRQALTNNRPLKCPKGVYCLEGVATD